MPANILAGADIRIGSLKLRMTYLGGRSEKILRAELVKDFPGDLSLQDLSKEFNDTPFAFPMPEALESFGLRLRRIGFSYAFMTSVFTFTLTAEKYGSLNVKTWHSADERFFLFRLHFAGKRAAREISRQAHTA